MPEGQPLAANTNAIQADLAFFTRRWNELGEPVWLELRAFNALGKPSIGRFRHDAEGLDMAAEWAAAMNNKRLNVYAVRNPIRDACTGSAKDTDIAAAFYLWADCDDGDATSNVKAFTGLRPNAVIRTGATPAERVHVYYELEEPCANLDAWRAVQEAIAAHFGSDDKVVNPSRIMRVAGTVCYPAEHKQARGYVSEVAAMLVPEDRDPVPFEQAMRVWPAKPRSASQSAADGGFGFDAGPQAMDRERARIQALSGEAWHNEVVRLVASYVRAGLSDEEIHRLTDPLTLPGYTVEDTRREVQTAINGARRKGFDQDEAKTHTNFDFPPEDEAPKSEPENEEEPGTGEWAGGFDAGEANQEWGTEDPDPGMWLIQSTRAFIDDFVAPEWLVDGVLQRGKFYTLTAPTGHGKTALMLYMAAQFSTGGQFCGLDVEGGDVLFLAGENPDDVRARVIVSLNKYGINPDACRVHFVPGTFSIRKDMKKLKAAASKLPDLSLVVVDTFAAYFDGEDENSNAQALDFARVVRKLTQLPSRPAVVMPAHPVKGAGKANLVPKGGSSLLNEVDGNFSAWREETVVTLHWQGKIRGPDFQPLQCELKKEEDDAVRDKRGKLMPSVVAVPVLEMRAKSIIRENMSREDAVLLNVEKWPGMSTADRCVEIGLTDANGKAIKSTMHAILMRLRNAKLITKEHREYVLTDAGRRACAKLRGGDAGEVELED